MKLLSKRYRPSRTGALLGLALAFLLALPLAWGAVSAGEGRVYDLLLRCRSNRPDPRVILVGIDDATFSALGGRMPTRAEEALVIERLWSAGASLIALDLFFVSPRDGTEDAAFESALSKADTVLACSPTSGLQPVEAFRKRAVGVGSIDLLTDPDGVMRRLPPPFLQPAKDGSAIPALPFALEIARLIWFPGGAPPARSDSHSLWLGQHPYPLATDGWLIPFYGGDGTLPRLSFKDAFDTGKPLPNMKDKIVLMGSTRPSQHDLFSVPFPTKLGTVHGFRTTSTHTMAGVELHGQALSALLQGESIRPLTATANAVLFALLAAVGTLLTAFPFRPAFSVPIWASLGIILFGGAILAVRNGRTLPLLALGLCWLGYAGASLSYHWYRDFKEKRAVQRLFARYVSPNVARELLENPDLVQLGGRRKVLSILFSDIRGFTNLSERIPPEQVSALLNEYFTIMTQVLFRHDGTLDKYIGDAILAFFGDPLDQPDQAARALACAVAMQAEAAALRARSEAAGKPPLHIGIAVHTGPAVVGNNGSETNFLYTVIGDTVNLTARLQGLAVQDDVIITLDTAERIPDLRTLYRVESLDPVMVKGKSEPIPILRVLGRMP